MSNMIIRFGEEKDLPEMSEIEKECFNIPWTFDALSYDMLDNHMAVYFVAETDGKVVGYIGIWRILDECHINNVAVKPQYRRNHIGSALIERLLDYCKIENLNSQTLEVRQSNVPAIGLYSKFGFTSAGIRKGYYEDNGENAVIMWRTAEVEH